MAVTVSSRRSRTTATKASRRQPAKQTRPSEDQIRIYAYHLYEQRREDGLTGDAASDWIEAERRLSNGAN